MVLGNYMRMFNGVSQKQWIVTICGNTIDSTVPYSNTSNSYRTLQTLSGGVSNTYGSGGAGRVFVDVGFDDTPVTVGDTKLGDGNCKGNTSTPTAAYTIGPLTPLGSSRNSNTNREFLNVNQAFRNDTANDITVKEVGVIGSLLNSGDNGTMCLLCRKVLSTPIVIHPSESYNFNYRLRIRDN